MALFDRYVDVLLIEVTMSLNLRLICDMALATVQSVWQPLTLKSLHFRKSSRNLSSVFMLFMLICCAL